MYPRKPINSIPCALKDDKYIQLKNVGKGTYGCVSKARRKSDNMNVALKQIVKEKHKLSFSKYILREIHILKTLNHPNLVKMLDIVVDPKTNTKPNPSSYGGNQQFSKYLVFEYCEHDLEEAQYYNNKIDIWSVGHIMCQLLFRAKEKPYFYLFSDGEHQELGMAKEIFSLLGNPYDENIWSSSSRKELNLQVLDSFMSHFSQEQKAHFSYKLPEYLRKQNPDIDDNAVDLICSMMALDPSQRLSAEECLAHAFFSQEPLIASNSEMPELEKGQELHRMTEQSRKNKEKPEQQEEYNQNPQQQQQILPPPPPGQFNSLQRNNQQIQPQGQTQSQQQYRQTQQFQVQRQLGGYQRQQQINVGNDLSNYPYTMKITNNTNNISQMPYPSGRGTSIQYMNQQKNVNQSSSQLQPQQPHHQVYQQQQKQQQQKQQQQQKHQPQQQQLQLQHHQQQRYPAIQVNPNSTNNNPNRPIIQQQYQSQQIQQNTHYQILNNSNNNITINNINLVSNNFNTKSQYQQSNLISNTPMNMKKEEFTNISSSSQQTRTFQQQQPTQQQLSFQQQQSSSNKTQNTQRIPSFSNQSPKQMKTNAQNIQSYHNEDQSKQPNNIMQHNQTHQAHELSVIPSQNGKRKNNQLNNTGSSNMMNSQDDCEPTKKKFKIDTPNNQKSPQLQSHQPQFNQQRPTIPESSLFQQGQFHISIPIGANSSVETMKQGYQQQLSHIDVSIRTAAAPLQNSPFSTNNNPIRYDSNYQNSISPNIFNNMQTYSIMFNPSPNSPRIMNFFQENQIATPIQQYLQTSKRNHLQNNSNFKDKPYNNQNR